MAITVIVHVPTPTQGEVRLTFDGTQRVVIGRGSSSDVRLPDPSVSHRHATLRAQGADFLLVDEGSANGTFVGGVRVAPRTSRIVRSGDRVRIGRVTLELRIEQAPVTREVSMATRDLALALVAASMRPEDTATRLRVVEGPDQGASISLLEPDRPYLVGRGSHCDLPLRDADASREHARVFRRGPQVTVVDLGAKNGTWLGSARAPTGEEALWRSLHLLRLGKTVIALEEPVALALSEIEQAPDEPLPPEAAPVAPTPVEPSPPERPDTRQAASLALLPSSSGSASARPPRAGWAAADFAVMAAAATVLALSLAGLVWLLRGG
jgi:pSer/pThr/pTyr-binding forkhead associated (FHA) protein